MLAWTAHAFSSGTASSHVQVADLFVVALYCRKPLHLAQIASASTDIPSVMTF